METTEKAKYNGIIKNGKLEFIDIANLMPSKHNSYEIEDIEDLMGSILACGLITPIAVIGPMDNGFYSIMSGERRFKALTNLVADGHEVFKRVPCYICGDKDTDIFSQQFLIEIANLEVRNMSQGELDTHRLKILTMIKEDCENQEGIKHNDIHRIAKAYMGMSGRYRRMYLRIIEAGDQNIRQLIEDERLGVSQADAILSMDDDDRQNATERISNGEVASHVIADIRQKNKDDAIDEIAEEDGSSISDTAQAIMNGDEVSREDVINRYNELAEQELSKEYSSPLEKYSDYKPYNDDTSISDESKANMVMKWCKDMLKKDDLSDFADCESEAIDVCRRLVEYYDSL